MRQVHLSLPRLTPISLLITQVLTYIVGTGLWAIEVGRAFPQAEFIGECRIVRGGKSFRADTLTSTPTRSSAGIDLVPIQPK